MPLKRYDPYYGNARKAYLAMARRYGSERGKRVFYAKLSELRKVRRGR